MTVHAAKGLEFPVVFIVGLEQGLLPHSRARDSDAETEEERRLFFVGITRARRELYLSRTAVRTLRGVQQATEPSIFLSELPVGPLDVRDLTGLGGAGMPSYQAASDRERYRALARSTGPQREFRVTTAAELSSARAARSAPAGRSTPRPSAWGSPCFIPSMAWVDW